MKKDWYEGNELAIALAIAAGFLGYWIFGSSLFGVICAVIGGIAGTIWQRKGA